MAIQLRVHEIRRLAQSFPFYPISWLLFHHDNAIHFEDHQINHVPQICELGIPHH
jgi:hypothetical protein